MAAHLQAQALASTHDGLAMANVPGADVRQRQAYAAAELDRQQALVYLGMAQAKSLAAIEARLTQ
ncbi:hypothetical protein ABT297_22600 [Dactylosporangium sp. NPDC000555]|uniref:hypothetical protein n=1 Tax=Dactylosporangium sp. NPDC000555 TaxID=3154260 RepID=UPI00331A0DC3